MMLRTTGLFLQRSSSEKNSLSSEVSGEGLLESFCLLSL